MDFFLGIQEYEQIQPLYHKEVELDTSIITRWLSKENIPVQKGGYRFARRGIFRGKETIAFRCQHGDFFNWEKCTIPMPDSIIPLKNAAIEAVRALHQWERRNFAAKCSYWSALHDQHWRNLPRNMLFAHFTDSGRALAYLLRDYSDTRVMICTMNKISRLAELKNQGVRIISSTYNEFIGVASRNLATKLKLNYADEIVLVDPAQAEDIARESLVQWENNNAEKEDRYRAILEVPQERLVEAMCEVVSPKDLTAMIITRMKLRSAQDENGLTGMHRVEAHVYTNNLVWRDSSGIWARWDDHIRRVRIPKTDRQHEFIEALPDEFCLYYILNESQRDMSYQGFSSWEHAVSKICDSGCHAIKQITIRKDAVQRVLFDNGLPIFFVTGVDITQGRVLLINARKQAMKLSTPATINFNERFLLNVGLWVDELRKDF